MVRSQPIISGQTSSTTCTPLTGQCKTYGSSNYVSKSLTYDTSKGLFSGTLITNQCANKKNNFYNGISSGVQSSASCVQQTLPAPAYTSSLLPKAAPTRGIIAYSISGAADIYGPFDAGFQTGQACTNNLGSCPGGTDIDCCGNKLKYECGENYFKAMMFMDDCGGHANVYHYHFDLVCEYNISAPGHSALIGIGLDGRGIYGFDEITGSGPTDLDACGGHYGDVPASNGFPAATNVYHYHTQKEPPYTLGCYGPVTSLSQCKTLYSTCGDSFTNIMTIKGCYKNYDLDCPCFKMNGETYNQLNSSIITLSECSSTSSSTSSPSTSIPTSSSTPPTKSPSSKISLGSQINFSLFLFLFLFLFQRGIRIIFHNQF